MKKMLFPALIIVTTLACAKNEVPAQQTGTGSAGATASGATGTETTSSAAGETTYPMTATIVSRDPAKNTLNLDNQEVPGKMMAMKMAYEVRDAKVGTLPKDGEAVEVTMHDNNGSYYITNVKPKK